MFVCLFVCLFVCYLICLFVCLFVLRLSFSRIPRISYYLSLSSCFFLVHSISCTSCETSIRPFERWRRDEASDWPCRWSLRFFGNFSCLGTFFGFCLSYSCYFLHDHCKYWHGLWMTSILYRSMLSPLYLKEIWWSVLLTDIWWLRFSYLSNLLILLLIAIYLPSLSYFNIFLILLSEGFSNLCYSYIRKMFVDFPILCSCPGRPGGCIL